MKKEDWRRENECTRKRAFSTKDYAERYRDNVLGDSSLKAYKCRFCSEFHLGHDVRPNRHKTSFGSPAK